MGVKGLLGFFNRNNLIEKIFLPELIQKINKIKKDLNKDFLTIGVDTYYFSYRFSMNKKVIEGFEYQLNLFKILGLKPIYVFDCKTPKEKKDTIKKRTDKKQKYFARKGITKENDAKMTPDKQDQIMLFFDKNNVEYRNAKEEADHLLTYLAKENIIQLILGEDSDLVINSTKYMFNIINHDSFAWIDYEKILDKLGLTKEQMFEFAVLVGCDYNSKIIFCRCDEAHEYLLKYGSIENILENTIHESKDVFKNNYKNTLDIIKKKSDMEKTNIELLLPFH